MIFFKIWLKCFDLNPPGKGYIKFAFFAYNSLHDFLFLLFPLFLLFVQKTDVWHLKFLWYYVQFYQHYYYCCWWYCGFLLAFPIVYHKIKVCFSHFIAFSLKEDNNQSIICTNCLFFYLKVFFCLVSSFDLNLKYKVNFKLSF